MTKWINQNAWRVLLACSLTALLGLAVACGDDDDDATTSPTASGAATASRSAAPSGTGGGGDGEALKIGLLAPYTGGLASFGPQFENSVQLAVDQINEAGGVNGQDVELVTGDEGATADTAIAEATRLVETEGVHAIIGAASSTRALAVAESVTGPNEILQITPSGTSPALTAANDDDFLFRTPIHDTAQSLVLAQLVSDDLGYDSVCVMYENSAYGQGLSENFEAAYTGTVTASVSHASEGTTFASELNQCVAGDPEALVAISYPVGQAQVYLREALEGSLIDQFVFVDGTKDGQTFADLGWENFDGMKGTAPGALQTEEGDAFDASYEAAYGEGYSVPFIRESYDAAILIALAAQAAGTTDGAAMRDALREISNAEGTEYGPADLADALTDAGAGDDINYQGASGPIEFNDDGDILIGAVEVWHIDAAAAAAAPDDVSKGLVTESVWRVDLDAGTVEDITE